MSNEAPPQDQAPSVATHRWRPWINRISVGLTVVMFFFSNPAAPAGIVAAMQLIAWPLAAGLGFAVWDHSKLEPADSSSQWRDERLVFIGKNTTFMGVVSFAVYAFSHHAAILWGLLVLATIALSQIIKVPAEDRLKAAVSERPDPFS